MSNRQGMIKVGVARLVAGTMGMLQDCVVWLLAEVISAAVMTCSPHRKCTILKALGATDRSLDLGTQLVEFRSRTCDTGEEHWRQ
jgi:hypothetical protein